MPTQVEKSEQQLTDRLLHVGNYIEQIIQDQIKILDVALERIKGYKRDLKALRFRLKPYVSSRNPKQRNETYYRLKDEYEEVLQRIAVLERTAMVAEESITHARLNTVPGQVSPEGTDGARL